MKKFCISQVSVVTFSGGVGKWITVCFLLVPAYPGCPGSKAVKRSLLLLFLRDNIYNQKVCMNNTVENDFFGFSKVKYLHLTGEVDNL